MKNKIIVIEFMLILIVVLCANIIKKDDDISYTERRKLAQFPKFTTKTVLEGKAFQDFEKYTVDQFIKRDTFKEIKYWFSINALNQKDNNKMFVKDGSIFKMEYPLNEYAISQSAEKLENIQATYLNGMNVYYSIIPDKAYYIDNGNLKMDYSKIEKILSEKLENAKYIDIKETLTKEDFYRTDLHWKQENIVKVANVLKENMGLAIVNMQYEERDAGNFYGTYYGQVGTKIEPDTIKYLTTSEIENAVTYNYETKKDSKVYDLEKQKKSSDKYDIFLSGPVSLLTIENQESKSDAELLIFRDSFGSSIAPFMIENYKRITLIDLRYMSSKLLREYIDFDHQDVLFIYSGTVLNQNILK